MTLVCFEIRFSLLYRPIPADLEQFQVRLSQAIMCINMMAEWSTKNGSIP